MTKHRRRKKSKNVGLFFQIIFALFLLFVFVFLFDLLSRKMLVWGIAITGVLLLIGLSFHFLKRKTIKDGVFKKLGV